MEAFPNTVNTLTTADTNEPHPSTVVPLPYSWQDDLLIAGDYVPAHSEQRQQLVNPATEEVWGRVPQADEVDLERAVSAAHQAFDTWHRLPVGERAEILQRMADELENHRELLAHTITTENGTPISESQLAAPVSAGMLRYFASLADDVERTAVRPYPRGGGDSLVRHDPVGVCALIAPWNYPINLVAGKLAPALIAGCTVVIKPASPTPLSIRVLADAAHAAGVPAGVINILTGSGTLGETLVTHPGIDKVAFTGSTAVGRRIATLCGGLLRPVTLELGGKSSAVLLPDVDLDVLRSQLIPSCLRNTGQTCFISTRLLVPECRYNEVITAVSETVTAGPQGDPLDPGTVFGPSATAAQRASVNEHIRQAVADGFRVVAGGDAPPSQARGYFVTPTVFADVDPDSRIAQEEIFGPVLTISRYNRVEEAIKLANSTNFGLGGIVFGTDRENAERVASKIDTGSIGINAYLPNHAAPFGGRRGSGLGVEFGPEGLAAYLRPQSIHRPAL